jgi:L,D-transpeptidase catalytic domain
MGGPAPFTGEVSILPVTRRFVLAMGAASLAAAFTRPVLSSTKGPDPHVANLLLRRALDALDQHHASIERRDLIGIVDFSLPSSASRFHLLDVAGGGVTSHLVAHGRGSDPAHTGWLERFSNQPRSNATSAGAYKTGALYSGGHGRALRLEGLDASNSNAAARAIVVHGAPYVSAEMLRGGGVLGRSQGCFAVANSSLEEVLARLGPGRLIYADKV